MSLMHLAPGRLVSALLRAIRFVRIKASSWFSTMDVKVITLPSDRIVDWDTFHTTFKDTFGFPEYYGRNMGAWVDCMTYLDDPDAGMSSVTVGKAGLIVIQVGNAASFKNRCPEHYDTLLKYAAFVNYRRVEVGEAPVLALMLIGHYDHT